MKRWNLMLMVPICMVALAACNSTKSMGVKDLNGRWNIVSVEGAKVQAESTPFLEFTKEDATMRVHGNVGCNIMNAEVSVDSSDATSLTFVRPRTTMMACPDMDTEGKILTAINQVAHVASGEKNTQVSLTDKDGKTLLVIEKTDSQEAE